MVGAAPGTKCQGVALVERRLAGHRAVHRYLGQLRSCSALRWHRRITLPYQTRSPVFFAFREQLHRVFHVASGWGLSRSLGPLVAECRLGDLLAAEIGRNLDDDRSWASVSESMEGRRIMLETWLGWVIVSPYLETV